MPLTYTIWTGLPHRTAIPILIGAVNWERRRRFTVRPSIRLAPNSTAPSPRRHLLVDIRVAGEENTDSVGVGPEALLTPARGGKTCS